MALAKPQPPAAIIRNVDAVRITAAVFGVYAGILGIEHGFFETLQGNTVPRSLKILAVSPWELPFPFGHEPAMTVIPNFLATGIAAMVVGLSIVVWSAAFVQKKHGAAALLLLSITLLLVGGGFGPITLLIAACIAAGRIGKPLTWWRRQAAAAPVRLLAGLWVWFLGAALLWVPIEFVLGQILHLKNDHSQTLTNLNFLFSYPLLAFIALTLPAGFAHQARSRE